MKFQHGSLESFFCKPSCPSFLHTAMPAGSGFAGFQLLYLAGSSRAFKARCSRSYGKDEKEQDAWQMGKFALVSHLDHNNGPQNPCTGGLQSSMCVVSEV